MKRSFGIDLLRAIAIIFVIFVHVFYNTHYYETNQLGLKYFTFTCIRNLTFMCVPIFLILTGYCMSTKKVDKKYYFGLKKIIILYLIISIITSIYKILYLGQTFSLNDHVLGIFKFKTIEYSWYVEMYIGLYLLIPFLNKLYSSLDDKLKKYLFITLIILCVVPSTFLDIIIDNYNMNIFPNWWSSIYPLLYYFIGLNIKEKQYNLKKSVLIIIIITSIFFQSLLNFMSSLGGPLSITSSYASIFAIIPSVSTFLLLYNAKIRGKIFRTIIKYISISSLGTYLFSYLYDTLFYNLFNATSPTVMIIVKGLLIIAPLVFVCSLISTIILNKLIELIEKIINIIIKIHNKRYEKQIAY